MRSLFAKILGWFALALVATVIALVVTSTVSYTPEAKLRAPFTLLVNLGMEDARHAFESEGRAGLGDSLARFRRATRAATVYFTDAAGTDLLTGEQRPDLIRAAERWSAPFVHPNQMVFARFSSDGRYGFFVFLTPMRV